MTNKQDILDIFSNPIIIKDTSAPFASDKISTNNELKTFAENLESLINKELDKPKKDGLIISIYADWGFGKTTFVDMWGQSLVSNIDNKGIVALKFNAWKCDHFNEPILPFITVITRQINSYISTSGRELFKELISIAGKILRSTNIAGFDVGSFLDSLNERSIVDEFRNELIKIIGKLQNKKLYIFIDELDRCNPLFAIKLLEIAKHLFDVKGICFILAINPKSLVSTIERVYGLGDELAGKYLERFFDFQFRLPEPDKARYAMVNLGDVFNKQTNLKDFENKALELTKEVFVKWSAEYSNLRNIEKQAKEIRIFLEMNIRNLMDTNKRIKPIIFIPVVVYSLCLKYAPDKNDGIKFSDDLQRELFYKLSTIKESSKNRKSLEKFKNDMLRETINSRNVATPSEASVLRIKREIGDYFFIDSVTNYEEIEKAVADIMDMMNFTHEIEVETTT